MRLHGSIFHLGGITTSGDELSPRHLALQKAFATAGAAACCKSLTANLKVGGEEPECCLCRDQQQPGAPGSSTRVHLQPSPSSPGASAPSLQHPAPPWTAVGKQEPSPALQSLCGARVGREVGWRCLLRRVQINLLPHFQHHFVGPQFILVERLPPYRKTTTDKQKGFALKLAQIPGSASLGEHLKRRGNMGASLADEGVRAQGNSKYLHFQVSTQ